MSYKYSALEGALTHCSQAWHRRGCEEPLWPEASRWPPLCDRRGLGRPSLLNNKIRRSMWEAKRILVASSVLLLPLTKEKEI